MIVNVISPAPRDIWDKVLAEDPFALESQSSAWTDALCQSLGYTDASRMYEMSDGRKLVLPLLRRSVAGLSLFEGSNPAHCGVGGILASEGPRCIEVAAVLQDVVARRALVRSFWPHPGLATEWANAVPEGTTVIPRRAHLLNLDGGWDAVWSNRFTSSRRRGVRHAERSGVTVERGTSGQFLTEFYSLLTLATTRWARMQHEPRWLTLQRLRRRDPLRKFEAIASTLGERFRIWLAYVDGRPVAGLVVLQGVNAYYFRGAMDERMKSYGANNLLMSRSIEDACAAGCQNYYLGDTGWSPSAADFKERFGGLAYHYSEYRLEKLPLSVAERGAKSIVKRAIGFRDF